MMNRLASVRDALGQPYYGDDNCLIYNLECVDSLKYLTRPVLNATVTSPPYNIGKSYEQIVSMDRYVEWTRQWAAEVYRLSLANSAFWLNLGYAPLPGRGKAVPLPYLVFPVIPFFLVQEIVWNYGAGVAGRKFFSPRNEKFLWFVKNPDDYVFNLDEVRDPNVKYPRQFKNGRLKVNPNGKNPSDVWQIAKITSGRNRSSIERTDHPAQFPTELVSRILKATTMPGDLVLDPFLGSGSTAEAALKLGRQVVGFEINSEYCEIAATRASGVTNDRHLVLPLTTTKYQAI